MISHYLQRLRQLTFMPLFVAVEVGFGLTKPLQALLGAVSLPAHQVVCLEAAVEVGQGASARLLHLLLQLNFTI